jgi:hypothetical protein
MRVALDTRLRGYDGGGSHSHPEEAHSRRLEGGAVSPVLAEGSPFETLRSSG